MPELDNFSDAPGHILQLSHSEIHRTGVSFLAGEWGYGERKVFDGRKMEVASRGPSQCLLQTGVILDWCNHGLYHILAQLLSLAGSELSGSFSIVPL